MEERIVLVPSHKLEALAKLIQVCSDLWEADMTPKNDNQRLSLQMLSEGVALVNKIIKNGQLRKGGEAYESIKVRSTGEGVG